MFFGVLRLRTRLLLLVAGFIISAYMLVLGALATQRGHLDPIAIEILRTMTLATVLVWFAFMGGYVHELRRRLRESSYDRLTGVHNRGRILDVLAHEQMRFARGGGSLCVCLVDADGLKGINDTLGHRAGDLALQAIAQTAHRELRVVDAIGRYGGDEFLLVLSQTGLDGARECAERIRARIEVSDCFGGEARRPSPSRAASPDAGAASRCRTRCSAPTRRSIARNIADATASRWSDAAPCGSAHHHSKNLRTTGYTRTGQHAPVAQLDRAPAF